MERKRKGQLAEMVQAGNDGLRTSSLSGEVSLSSSDDEEPIERFE